MKPTEAQIKTLMDSNYKAKMFILKHGSFDKLPDHIKLLFEREIDKTGYMEGLNVEGAEMQMRKEIGLKLPHL